jgi:hypothetical protein
MKDNYRERSESQQALDDRGAAQLCGPFLKLLKLTVNEFWRRKDVV